MILADAPNWADVLQGIGSILAAPALLVTLYAVVREARTRRQEREDTDAAAQARLVVGVIEAADRRGQLDDITGVITLVGPVLSVAYKVENFSESPIFDVSAWIVRPDGRVAHSERYIGPVRSETVGTRHILDPPEPLLPARDDLREMFNIGVAFTDAHGLRWERIDHDKPSRLLTPDELEAQRRKEQRFLQLGWLLLGIAAGIGANMLWGWLR